MSVRRDEMEDGDERKERRCNGTISSSCERAAGVIVFLGLPTASLFLSPRLFSPLALFAQSLTHFDTLVHFPFISGLILYCTEVWFSVLYLSLVTLSEVIPLLTCQNLHTNTNSLQIHRTSRVLFECLFESASTSQGTHDFQYQRKNQAVWLNGQSFHHNQLPGKVESLQLQSFSGDKLKEKDARSYKVLCSFWDS